MQLVVRDHLWEPQAATKRVFPLSEGETLSVGRSPAVAIPLPVHDALLVARRQCDIRLQNGTAQILDYGGSPSALYFENQVFVNSLPLEQPYAWNDLRVGDTISIGDSELQVSNDL